MSVLLDVNALIALCWSSHSFHKPMQKWFEKHAANGWATCALTLAAFVRVSMHPGVSGGAINVEVVSDLLAEATSHSAHRLIPVVASFEQVRSRCTGGIVGHRQVTDAWLLASAIAQNMKLLTFDSGIRSLLATERERDAHIIDLS